MHINSLKLKGYKRIAQSGITEIEWNPNSRVQLIIGTNGSGKSSLLREAHFLPAESKHYEDGGYKYLDFDRHGNNYIVSSLFDGKAVHSFIKNGVEINDGGTATAQREIISREFGIGQDVLDILVGKTKFTYMSTNDRREWMLRLSGGDLDHAMSVFEDLKSKASKTKHIVSFTKERIANETRNIIPTIVLEPMLREMAVLREYLNTLMKNQGTISSNARDLQEQIDDNLKNAKLYSMKLFGAANALRILANNLGLTSYGQFEEVHHKAIVNLELMKQRAENIHLELKRVRDIKSVLQETNAKNGDVNSEIEECLKLRENYVNIADIFYQPKHRDKVTNLFQASVVVVPEAIQRYSAIPDNTDKKFTAEKQSAAREAINKAMSDIDHIKAKRVRADERLKHLDAKCNETCPHCKRSIHVDSEGEKERILKLLPTFDVRERELEQLIAINEDYMEQMSDYISYRKYLVGFAQNHENCRTLWDIIWSDEKEGVPLSYVIGNITRWGDAVHAGYEAIMLDEKITRYRMVLEQSSSLMSLQGQHHDVEESLVNELQELTSSIASLEDDVTDLNNFNNHYTHAQLHLGYINNVVDRCIHAYTCLIKVMYREMLGEEINKNQTVLAELSATVNKAKSMADVLKDLEQQFTMQSHRQVLLNVMMAELSPVNGLIADQLQGFLAGFVDTMNQVIASVWTYPLVIEPCGLTSGKMDFKFPVDSNNGASRVTDVVDVSDAQVDIVNFAFRFAVMLYLELSDFPIYLDEFGIAMDEVHRINCMQYVKELSESNQVGQTFMISHYVSSHGGFTNAETMVMCDKNIIHMPGIYNQHCVITRD